MNLLLELLNVCFIAVVSVCVAFDHPGFGFRNRSSEAPNNATQAALQKLAIFSSALHVASPDIDGTFGMSEVTLLLLCPTQTLLL